MVEITKRVHTIDGFTHPFSRQKGCSLYVYRNADDLTLIDPSFLPQLPILEDYILNAGYDIKNVKRIILTHLHIDHAQAANEIRKRTGAKIYSHWIEAGYLAHNPPYNDPPTSQAMTDILKKSGVSIEELTKKFESMELDLIIVDEQVSDENMIGSLEVIHTPGIYQDICHFIMKKIEFSLVQTPFTSVYLEQRVYVHCSSSYGINRFSNSNSFYTMALRFSLIN